MGYRKRTLLPIGIHFNADAVSMVQLEQAEGGLGIVSRAAQQFAVPPLDADGASPEAVRDSRYDQAREFVRRTITTDGFRGKEAVISLPAESLVIRHVRLAPMQPEELASSLPVELQGKLPYDPREAVVRHIVAGTVSDNNETKQDVIVMAAHRSAVEKQVAAMTKLGLLVVGVGVEPCAMGYPWAYAASLSSPTQEGPQSLMLVHLAPRTTYVGVVRGQETTFVKGVEHGTDALTQGLAEAKGLSPAEAAGARGKWADASDAKTLQEAVEAYNGIRRHLEPLVDEVESCMRYHASLARGAHIDRLLFVGQGARDRALVRVLGARLGVACEVGDPLANVGGGDSRREARPELAVAMGLSLFSAP